MCAEARRDDNFATLTRDKEMLLQEQLAKDRINSMLAEARESRLARQHAALIRARRRADRAAARLNRAERAVTRLRSALHADA
jgi:hypothetical protein